MAIQTWSMWLYAKTCHLKQDWQKTSGYCTILSLFFMTFNILHNTSSWLSGMWWGMQCVVVTLHNFNLINVKISISWKHPSNNVSYKILIMVHLLLPFYGKGCFLKFQFSKLIYVLGILHWSHVLKLIWYNA